MPSPASTIFARASGQGKSGIAVYRISGPSAVAAVTPLLGDGRPLQPRSASLRSLVHPSRREIIDEAILLFFPASASFTGEDVVEIQAHGSPAVERQLLEILAEIPDCRLAEPGEFTRRAFENGRLDLNQVEGLADLIQAETETQHRLAMRSLRGEASDLVLGWRTEIVRCLALVEAAVDFADEDEDTSGYGDAIRHPLAKLAAAIGRELESSTASERLRSGIEIAVIGPVNSGKSLFINTLVGRELALSTPVAGTTRDIIEAHLDIGGLPVTILDTAGLRETADAVEAAGVERAGHRASHADLRIHLFSVDAPAPDPLSYWKDGDILACNKSDLPGFAPVEGTLSISALTGAGIPALVMQLQERLAWIGDTASPVAATIRRRTEVRACAAELDAALLALDENESAEIVAERLRQSLLAIERHVGRVDVEELLDIVFSEFCLGK